MNYYIYLITNKRNNKQYVGQTINYEKRIKEHIYGRNGNKNSIIDRAIKKYGKNNFDFSVIEITKSSQEADRLEKKYIKEFKTLKPKGYNVLIGGRNQQGSWNQKPILTYNLDGIFLKEYSCSGELERISNGKYSSRLIRGACATKTHKCKDILVKYKENKCIIEKYNKPSSSRRIKINQYDLDGNFLKTYNSLQEASNLTKTRRTSISGCLSGTYKTANGFIWKKSNDNSIIPKNIKYFLRNPIYQLDDNKNILKEFKSCTEAQDYLGLQKGKYKRIWANLDKNNKVYGYYWKRVKRQSCAKPRNRKVKRLSKGKT